MTETIQEPGAPGELVGGIAVIITLVYLALQIRHNTRAIRLCTNHAVTEESHNMFRLIAGNPSLAELIHKSATDPASLTGADKVPYRTYKSNFIRASGNAFIQWTHGALDNGQWLGMKRMLLDHVHLPAFQDYWLNRKHWYSD